MSSIKPPSTTETMAQAATKTNNRYVRRKSCTREKKKRIKGNIFEYQRNHLIILLLRHYCQKTSKI